MDKIILISGGSRDVGEATARMAAEQGYIVCFTYRTNREKADSLVADIKEKGGLAYEHACDVAHEPDVLSVSETIEREVGRLTALVNNAGTLEPRSRFEEMSLERWNHTFIVNLFGSVACSHRAVKRMSHRYGGHGGAIDNILLAASRKGGVFEFTDYAASKGAMDTMTIGPAKEVATEGIRVNAVRPGLTYTDITADNGQPDRVEELAHIVPMKRGGTAMEVAHAILWLHV
jgi:NAD(P)-dependent dehydrogenase (short-subunit alcohol dehydrogenase family)